MTYVKPQLLNTRIAGVSIQGNNKGPNSLDNDGSGDFNATSNAYAADE